MITRDQIIDIGHINKTHGVSGEMNASLLVDMEVMAQLSCIVLDMDGIYVPFFIQGIRPKGAQAILLTIEDIGDEASAAALVGRDIYALKTDYNMIAHRVDEDDDQLPIDYFIGFALLDRGHRVGEIVQVEDSTDNVLFVVRRDDDATVYVPAVDDLIEAMDMDKRIIHMILPEGLLDI